MSIVFLRVCAYVWHGYAVPAEARGGSRFPGARGINDCHPPCGSWEQNPHALLDTGDTVKNMLNHVLHEQS